MSRTKRRYENGCIVRTSNVYGNTAVAWAERFRGEVDRIPGASLQPTSAASTDGVDPTRGRD